MSTTIKQKNHKKRKKLAQPCNSKQSVSGLWRWLIGKCFLEPNKIHKHQQKLSIFGRFLRPICRQPYFCSHIFSAICLKPIDVHPDVWSHMFTTRSLQLNILAIFFLSDMCNQMFAAKSQQPTSHLLLQLKNCFECSKPCSVQSIGAEAEPVKY